MQLAKIPFFTDFPAEVLETLGQLSTIRKFKKNTVIIVEGDQSHAAYILIKGTAKAFTSDEEGNEFVVNTFKAHDCFGELGLLDDLPRTANVETTSDCECLVISKPDLMNSLESNALASLAIVRVLVGRIRAMTDDVSCLALMDVYGRITRVIRSAAVDDGNGVRITERMTHKELANRVGSSREMVSKIIKDLKDGGYIDIQNHCIILLKSLPLRW